MAAKRTPPAGENGGGGKLWLAAKPTYLSNLLKNSDEWAHRKTPAR